MALEGSLRDFGLADILQLIFFQRKTGVLNLEGRVDKIKLLFIEGNIVGAESKRRIEANRLGKILVKKGLISEDELRSLVEEHMGSNLKLGTFLVRKGIVKKEDIEEILIGQIKETIIQVFNWKEGTYEFTPQAIPVDRDLPITIDTQHLLMEGLRIVDEWTLIEGKITLDTVFVRKGEDVSDLSEEEREILLLVDGDNDVSTIIDISGKDDFTVSKALVGLTEKGKIEPKEVLPVVTETVPVGVRRSFLRHRYFSVGAIVIAVVVSFLVAVFSSDPLVKGFRAARVVDDLRFQVEAHRFQYGSYPESLEDISRQRDPWGNAYVYQRTETSFLLFCTGPDGLKGTPDDIY